MIALIIENVDYLWVSIAAGCIIVFNRILSCYYILKFTESYFDMILNIFDFYIFREIFASHESGNKTDLMQVFVLVVFCFVLFGVVYLFFLFVCVSVSFVFYFGLRILLLVTVFAKN